MICMPEELAIFGGPKAVTIEDKEAFGPWPVITDETIELVKDCLRKGWISGTPPVVTEFEEEFARYHDVKYALSMNNGTAAIQAALFAVGVGPGDEVITPSYTWHCGVTPILACHGIPVFCEIDPKTLCADPEDIERRITSKTKAMIVTHLWGVPAEMDRIMEIAEDHDLPVIEDASHAHGGIYKGKKVGSIGDIGCFSLQASKAMVAGEGGILITNNEEYLKWATALGNFERLWQWPDHPVHKFANAHFGLKFRIHPLAAAIAYVQLKYLDERNKVRRENHTRLVEGLKDIEGIEPPYIPRYVKMGGWYGFRIKYYSEKLLGIPKETFAAALRAEGVAASLERYPLLHLEPIFTDRKIKIQGGPIRCPYEPRRFYKKGDLPITEEVFSRLIALPKFEAKPCKELIDQHIEAIRKVVSNIKELKEKKIEKIEVPVEAGTH